MRTFFRIGLFILFLMIFAQIYFIIFKGAHPIFLIINVMCFVMSYYMILKE